MIPPVYESVRTLEASKRPARMRGTNGTGERRGEKGCEKVGGGRETLKKENRRGARGGGRSECGDQQAV